MVARMRATVAFVVAFAVVGPSCSKSEPPTTPTPTQAVITLAAQTQAAVRPCQPCGADELEIAADLTVTETSGVGGSVTSIDVSLRRGATVLAGPGQYNAANVASFAGGTNRVSARGSLIIRNVAMHFPGALRDQLPATFSMRVTFRDDNGHIVTGEAS